MQGRKVSGRASFWPFKTSNSNTNEDEETSDNEFSLLGSETWKTFQCMSSDYATCRQSPGCIWIDEKCVYSNYESCKESEPCSTTNSNVHLALKTLLSESEKCVPTLKKKDCNDMGCMLAAKKGTTESACLSQGWNTEEQKSMIDAFCSNADGKCTQTFDFKKPAVCSEDKNTKEWTATCNGAVVKRWEDSESSAALDECNALECDTSINLANFCEMVDDKCVRKAYTNFFLPPK